MNWHVKINGKIVSSRKLNSCVVLWKYVSENIATESEINKLYEIKVKPRLLFLTLLYPSSSSFPPALASSEKIVRQNIVVYSNFHILSKVLAHMNSLPDHEQTVHYLRVIIFNGVIYESKGNVFVDTFAFYSGTSNVKTREHLREHFSRL